MKLVVFGLSISSSWGNGHATLWRGLVSALARRGCMVVFFERDVPYYAANRDLNVLHGAELKLYSAWADVSTDARNAVGDADAVIVTSYCPDAIVACELTAQSSRALRIFYDLDTPVTLSRVEAGENVPYIGSAGLSGYDLVLSYTGGEALRLLVARLGAPRVEPLYGHVDPDVYARTPEATQYRADLSYLGTYAADRQPQLETMLVAAAARRPDMRFVIGGAQYPPTFPWQPNIHFVRHLPPGEHPAFYSSSRLTLNVTRSAMARMGWCPSGRLFEAAACGCPVISDDWDGLADFFTPGTEILVANETDDVIAALEQSPDDLQRIGEAARQRALEQHTSANRAEELLQFVEVARRAPSRSPEVQNA